MIGFPRYPVGVGIMATDTQVHDSNPGVASLIGGGITVLSQSAKNWKAVRNAASRIIKSSL